MTQTSAVTFTQKIKPFSEQFNRDMQGVITDMHSMLQYLQPLQHLIARGDVAGEGGGAGGFPAKIVENQGGGIYLIKEVLQLPDPEHIGTKSRQGFACNIAELTGPSQDPGLKGTGLTTDCVAEILSIGGVIDVENIKLDLVVCHEYSPVVPVATKEGRLGNALGAKEVPAFFFHHMKPFCVSCAGLPGDGDDGGGDDGGGDGDGGIGENGIQRVVEENNGTRQVSISGY